MVVVGDTSKNVYINPYKYIIYSGKDSLKVHDTIKSDSSTIGIIYVNNRKTKDTRTLTYPFKGECVIKELK